MSLCITYTDTGGIMENIDIVILNNLSRRRQEHKNNSEWYNENLIYEFMKMPNKCMQRYLKII